MSQDMNQSSGRSTVSDEGGAVAEDETSRDLDSKTAKNEESAGTGEDNFMQVKKEHQRRHTQNSRAKLNAKFDELLALVQPLYKVYSRHTPHRSEVLDYAIHAYYDLIERKIFLETEIALSSEKSLASYLQAFVASNPNLTKVLEFFVSMVCAKKQWRFGEVWLANESSPNSVVFSGYAIHPTVAGEELTRVQNFISESQNIQIRPPEDLIGRVFYTQRTEWMNDLKDAEVFVRSSLALNAGFQTVFALPVMDRSNTMLAVTSFFARDVRDYDSATVVLASELASTIVGAYEQLYDQNEARPSGAC